MIKMMKIKRKKREGEEEKEKIIRCCWFTVICNGPAIEQLKSYQKY